MLVWKILILMMSYKNSQNLKSDPVVIDNLQFFTRSSFITISWASVFTNFVVLQTCYPGDTQNFKSVPENVYFRVVSS